MIQRIVVQLDYIKADTLNHRTEFSFSPNVTMGFIIKLVPLISVKLCKSYVKISDGGTHRSLVLQLKGDTRVKVRMLHLKDAAGF